MEVEAIKEIIMEIVPTKGLSSLIVAIVFVAVLIAFPIIMSFPRDKKRDKQLRLPF